MVHVDATVPRGNTTVPQGVLILCHGCALSRPRGVGFPEPRSNHVSWLNKDLPSEPGTRIADHRHCSDPRAVETMNFYTKDC